MIKIAVVGASGKMGQAVIQAVQQSDKATLGALLDKGDSLDAVLDKFDTVIDFTRPEASLNYLKICEQSGKSMVIGTTGFDDSGLSAIHQAAKNIPILLAPNMSVGVNLSLTLLNIAARAIGENSDIEIIETHHRGKVDAPSGTALRMGEVVANALGRDLKQCSVYGRVGIEAVRDKNTIGFSTIRGGDVIGEHTVSFFMQGERVEITHKASSRLTFANGAVRAAHWLMDKPADLYSMEDVLAIK